MPNDPMRAFLTCCGYWCEEENDVANTELWSNGDETVRLKIDGQGFAEFAVLEDRFSAQLNLEDLLALLDFPVKRVA